jgi:hypothetical protein
VGLERSPLSLVRIIEELLEWKSTSSGQENRINGLRDPLRWSRDTLYPQKLALTSPTSGGRSVGIVRLRTKGHGVFLLGTGCFEPQIQEPRALYLELKLPETDNYHSAVSYSSSILTDPALWTAPIQN